MTLPNGNNVSHLSIVGDSLANNHSLNPDTPSLFDYGDSNSLIEANPLDGDDDDDDDEEKRLVEDQDLLVQGMGLKPIIIVSIGFLGLFLAYNSLQVRTGLHPESFWRWIVLSFRQI
jgi:hypothetical protein